MNEKLWMSATGIHYQFDCCRMEAKSRMLERKVILIDLFVPFQLTTSCCKTESSSRSESISSLSNHEASLLMLCAGKSECKSACCSQKCSCSSLSTKRTYVEVYSLKGPGRRR